MNDLLLPRTDAGALAQLVAVVLLTILGVVLVPHERALVLLVIGIGTLLVGLMGLRTLH